MLPLHRAPGRQPTLFVGQQLIPMEHHGVQSPHGQEQLSVQLSSTVAIPDGGPAKISLSCSEVCYPKSPGLFPSVQPVVSLYVESGSHQQAQWCLESSLRHWPLSAGGHCRLICRCEYLYKSCKILFESQGSGRGLFKFTGQVFIQFPLLFQALVLRCALAGWFEHVAGATSRAFSLRIFPPDQRVQFKL